MNHRFYVNCIIYVYVGCSVFVYEETLGIVTASIIERLNGERHCILLDHLDMPQSISPIAFMNFNDNIS